MENKLQNLKFRVYSEEHSRAIQKRLFELDKTIVWYGESEQNINIIPHHYLYLCGNKHIQYGTNDKYFEEDDFKSCTLDELYKMQAEPNPQSELMTKLESLQKELDKVKEEISKLNK